MYSIDEMVDRLQGMVDGQKNGTYPKKTPDIPYRINTDFVWNNLNDQCGRDKLVHFLPMVPLMEQSVAISEADHILYAHYFGRMENSSEYVLFELYKISQVMKHGAELIILGRSATFENDPKFYNYAKSLGLDNITFIGENFTKVLGERFGMDIQDHHVVYDEIGRFGNNEPELNIWPVDGCSKSCSFCRRNFMTRPKLESLPLEQIKEQLDFIKMTNPHMLKTINMRAENLTLYGVDIYGKKMLHEFINLLGTYPIEQLNSFIGLDIAEITPEMLDAMKHIPLNKIALNIEHGSERILEMLNKGLTLDKTYHVYETLRNAHPDVYIDSLSMIGFPSETKQDVYDHAKVVSDLRPNRMLLNHYYMEPQHPLARLPQLSEKQVWKLQKAFIKSLQKYSSKSNNDSPIELSYATSFYPAEPGKSQKYDRMTVEI